jgi:hypothetical protein
MEAVKVVERKRKKIVAAAPILITPEEAKAVVGLLKWGVSMQGIQRRRQRPMKFIGSCLLKVITNLESENRELREMLRRGEGNHRSGLSIAA